MNTHGCKNWESPCDGWKPAVDNYRKAARNITKFEIPTGDGSQKSIILTKQSQIQDQCKAWGASAFDSCSKKTGGCMPKGTKAYVKRCPDWQRQCYKYK